MLQARGHMPDVLLTSLGGILQPPPPESLPESDRLRVPVNILPLQSQQFAHANSRERDTAEENLPPRRHLLQNLLNVLRAPNRHLLVNVLRAMKFSADGIVFDQIVFRRYFKHDLQLLVDVQY